jgi:uncharacterized damage-inducible protein DinB
MVIRSIFAVFSAFGLVSQSSAQEAKLWTESDRKYLIDNLVRTKNELISAANNLTEQQWRFKECPEKWSINQVVEHIAIYELMFQRQITQTLASGARPELNKLAKADSTYLKYVLDPTPRLTTEFTKPFTYADPMGLNDGENNMAWFLKMRNESIAYLQTTPDDLRSFYLTTERPNVHQLYLWTFGHVDRALRQINRIKQDSHYPSNK